MNAHATLETGCIPDTDLIVVLIEIERADLEGGHRGHREGGQLVKRSGVPCVNH